MKEIELDFPTLAEKCAWSSEYSYVLYCAIPANPQRAEYPDMWYQGVLSFEDIVLEINLEEDTATLIYNPIKEGGILIDMVNLSVERKI